MNTVRNMCHRLRGVTIFVKRYLCLQPKKNVLSKCCGIYSGLVCSQNILTLARAAWKYLSQHRRIARILKWGEAEKIVLHG